MTSVVLADDEDLVRMGLRVMLEMRGIEVLAEAANGREALRAASEQDPDVLVMDIRMPVMDGIAATRELAHSGLQTRVLILTTYDLDQYVYDALRAGASGFLLKTTPPDELVKAVEIVARGEALLAPAVTRRLIEEYLRKPRPSPIGQPFNTLTDREREVLVLIARGMSNSEIATTLFVSDATVKTHINRILSKTHARSRAHAVVLAYEGGLVEPGSRS
jgi:DNA-binding NarL/FixJ family response regulator